MKIGILKERKDGENRVAMIPDDCKVLVDMGHTVYVEHDAGKGCGYDDKDYINAGCEVGTCTPYIWVNDLTIKVKEPEPDEYKYFRCCENLLCFLHFAGTPGLKEALDSYNVKYTELESLEGEFTPLKEMGTIAGEEAWKIVKEHAYLDKYDPVGVVGMGHVGRAAARKAREDGATVYTYDLDNINDLDINIEYLRGLILSAYSPLERSPIVVTEEMVRKMAFQSIIVDVSIDQGGNCETSKITKHSDPVFSEHGVFHYCVPNIPARVPKRASVALSEAILAYLLTILAK